MNLGNATSQIIQMFIIALRTLPAWMEAVHQMLLVRFQVMDVLILALLARSSLDATD